jgi:cytochrome b subunit of formate dehydrogenase
MSIVKTLADVLEPWATLYKDSKPVQVGVMFTHLGALVVGGGLALTKDREVIRAVRDGTAGAVYSAPERVAVHRTVVAALAVLALSGLALLAADVETFLVSPVYWSKMTLVVLLLLNGAWMLRIESRLGGAPSAAQAGWKMLRNSSRTSAALWFSIVLLGVWLENSG